MVELDRVHTSQAGYYRTGNPVGAVGAVAILTRRPAARADPQFEGGDVDNGGLAPSRSRWSLFLRME